MCLVILHMIEIPRYNIHYLHQQRNTHLSYDIFHRFYRLFAKAGRDITLLRWSVSPKTIPVSNRKSACQLEQKFEYFCDSLSKYNISQYTRCMHVPFISRSLTNLPPGLMHYRYRLCLMWRSALSERNHLSNL